MLLVGSPLCGSGVGAMGNIYTTPSTDGTNMYVTGLMQVDMANAPVCEEPSNPCARANHTYTQTVKITSPSGRTASCNFQSAYPALTAVNLRCEASLAIDGEGGTDTSSDDQQADCTIAGEFLYAVTPLQNPLIYSGLLQKGCGCGSSRLLHPMQPEHRLPQPVRYTGQLSILPMDRGPDYYRGQLYVRGCHRIRKPMLLPRSSTGGHPDGRTDGRAWPLGAAPPMWAHAVGSCIAGG